MSQVSVTPLDAGRYRVEVREGDITTTHEVAVPDGLLEGLGLSGADPVSAVRETFAFLLDREPASSILRRFSLDQVPRYFPEYYDELRTRMAG